MIPRVICPYCHQEAKLDKRGLAWRCDPCDAMVGCHKNSGRYAPLGLLAKPEDRKLRAAAHEVFDKIWNAWGKGKTGRGNARQIAYHWLAFELNIHPDQCHIGMFNAHTCRRVIALCEQKATGGKNDSPKT